LKFTKIVWFEAGENMKAYEWIRIADDPIIMRCDTNHLDFSGVVALYNNVVDYIKGDLVPVYLIIKKEQYTCPTCGGSGVIEEI